VAVILTGYSLTLGELVRVARDREQVGLSDEARARIRESREVVSRAVERGGLVYGLNTGVGVRKRVRIPLAELEQFNRRLILEHRVGQGPSAPEPVVRAQMLRLANGFARGTAGVRIELVDRIVAALNDGSTPTVRMLGSIGQSDLPANADLAYGLLDGFELAAKEGIALLNHNGYSTALSALALADARRLLDSLDVAGALDLEALGANLTLLHPAIAEHRPFTGLAAELERLRALLEGSYLWDEHAARSLQDPLSFRCLPQVHGAARDALAFAEGQLATELNASQENPLVVIEEDRVVSVGNFDVLPLAAAVDFVRIALAPVLTTASERTVKLLQAPLTGLPEGLAAETGLSESGLSEFGVPVQALAAEARLLAHPVSIETGSTSHHEGIEDRITLAPLAARRLGDMVELGERLAAIGLVVAAQAIDLRGARTLGRGTRVAYGRIRARVPQTARSEPPPQDLEPVVGLVREGLLVEAGRAVG
jgi:histidine ammonia-lyase